MELVELINDNLKDEDYSEMEENVDTLAECLIELSEYREEGHKAKKTDNFGVN